MKLSPRCQQVCDLAIAGATLQDSAALMGVSINTIKCYRRRLYRYLGVGSKIALMRKLGHVYQEVTENKTKAETYIECRNLGMSYKEISEKFGVGDAYLRNFTQRMFKKSIEKDHPIQIEKTENDDFKILYSMGHHDETDFSKAVLDYIGKLPMQKTPLVQTGWARLIKTEARYQLSISETRRRGMLPITYVAY